jgi:hypothetical protein
MSQCSVEFIANFERRNCLTYRMIYFKRRPSVIEIEIENQRWTWLVTIRKLLQNVPWNCIINWDEISWLLHPNDILI